MITTPKQGLILYKTPISIVLLILYANGSASLVNAEESEENTDSSDAAVKVEAECGGGVTGFWELTDNSFDVPRVIWSDLGTLDLPKIYSDTVKTKITYPKCTKTSGWYLVKCSKSTEWVSFDVPRIEWGRTYLKYPEFKMDTIDFSYHIPIKLNFSSGCTASGEYKPVSESSVLTEKELSEVDDHIANITASTSDIEAKRSSFLSDSASWRAELESSINEARNHSLSPDQARLLDLTLELYDKSINLASMGFDNSITRASFERQKLKDIRYEISMAQTQRDLDSARDRIDSTSEALKRIELELFRMKLRQK